MMLPGSLHICPPGELVDKRIRVDRGTLKVAYTYDDGTELTVWVEGEEVKFESNRPWTADLATGQINFHDAPPS